MTSGIVLIDKAQGWTSHDVVARCRRVFNMKRIGHTGTLDPMATGLMVVCLGQATRLVEYMTAHDKRYEGRIVLGERTTTDDAEGDVVERLPVPELNDADLSRIESAFTGDILQRPPAFSAVSVGGRRAYAVARAGGTLELAERPVTVHSVRLALCGANQLDLQVHCGPGTYIRSIARDIGTLLGCGAHLSQLRRLSVGRFDVRDAVTLEQLPGAIEASDGELVLPLDDGVCTMEAALVEDAPAALLANGLRHQLAGLGIAIDPVRVYSRGGSFVGVGSIDQAGEMRLRKVLTLASELA